MVTHIDDAYRTEVHDLTPEGVGERCEWCDNNIGPMVLSFATGKLCLTGICWGAIAIEQEGLRGISAAWVFARHEDQIMFAMRWCHK